MTDNTLYYGDNLDILRRHIKDETVDLVYLDPPFNSNATYNVLFAEQNGTKAAAQIKAFGDTWKWDEAAAKAYHETVEAGGKVSEALQAFAKLVPESNMLAYLAMMAPRLVELRRVLKPTGSIYLHCDPTASHYLKLLMDAVFGPANYRNEITWLRSKNPKGSQHDAKRYSPDTDSILFYGASERATLAYLDIKRPLTPAEVSQKYDRRDQIGPFTDGPILRSPSMGDRPNLVYTYKGYTPGPYGWRVSLDKLIQIDGKGNLGWSSTGKPYRKLRPEDDTGGPVGSCWMDIPPVNPQAAERLGYPTQKPVALLERIINASSNPGDLVLDPFCGCGTAIDAAQRTGRRWIGIDITHLAINLIRYRLASRFGDSAHYRVIGEPVTLPDAEVLARSDPYQFQFWALGLVGARPAEQKKGADRGIDGRLYFHDDVEGTKTKQVVLSVKAGHTNVTHVRDLRGVMDREKAEIGVLITMQEPTQPMRVEAAGAGVYHSPGWNTDYARLQIVTIAELLAGKRIDMPPLGQVNVTFKKAPRAKVNGETMPLPLGPQLASNLDAKA